MTPASEHPLPDDRVQVTTTADNIVRLNISALAVWRLCLESLTPADMVARLRQAVTDARHDALAAEVQQVLGSLLDAGLVRKPGKPTNPPDRETIPVELITLNRDEARRRHVETRTIPWLRYSPSQRFSPRIFDAIDGYDSTSVRRALGALDVAVSPEFERDDRPGQIGCYLSHLSVLSRLLNEDFSSAVILEDDACIHQVDFGCALGSIMTDVRDLEWDIVYLYIFDDQFQEHSGDENVRIPGKTYIDKPYYAWCTLAYLVNRSGAEKILAGSRTLSQAIDLRLQEMIDAGELQAFYTRRQFVQNIGQKTNEQPPKAHEFTSNVWP